MFSKFLGTLFSFFSPLPSSSASSGIVVFYRDGIAIGFDYISSPASSSSSTPQRGPLAIAGVLEDPVDTFDSSESYVPQWFAGDLDEVIEESVFFVILKIATELFSIIRFGSTDRR